MNLTPRQIAGYAYQAGVRGDEALATAVAVALAESNGDTDAHNPKPPDDSYGLWQINMLGAMGPTRRAQFGIFTNADLFNPAKNASAMYQISFGGRNWTPWTTYTRGTYKPLMDVARKGVDELKADLGQGKDAVGGVAKPGQVVGQAVDNLSGITDFFGKLMQPETWRMVALFVVGMALIIFALFKLTGNNKLEEGTKTMLKVAGAVVTKKVPAKLGAAASVATSVKKPGGKATLKAGAKTAAKGNAA